MMVINVANVNSDDVNGGNDSVDTNANGEDGKLDDGDKNNSVDGNAGNIVRI